METTNSTVLKEGRQTDEKLEPSFQVFIFLLHVEIIFIIINEGYSSHLFGIPFLLQSFGMQIYIRK